MRILGIVILLFFTGILLGQPTTSFSLVTEKNKINIGDEINVSLRLTCPANLDPKSIAYPAIDAGVALSDTLDILQSIPAKVSSDQDNQGNMLFIWQQDFTLGVYAGGNISIGPFQVIIGADTVLSNVATLQVLAPELDETQGFKGIKGVVTDPYTFWEKVWLWLKKYGLWVLLAIGLIVGIVLLTKYLSKKPEEKVVAAPKIPFPQVLLSKLEAIEKEELWQKGHHKEYYTAVTDVIRRYLEYKYRIHTLEKTSDEMLQSLKLSSISADDFGRLKNLFELSDMIKFAKSMPLPEENLTAMQIAKSLLTKELTLAE